MMNNFVKINLETLNGNKIYLNKEYLKTYEEELLEFLSDQDYMKNLKFAKSMLMGQEIKSNNNIKGIDDDLTIIDEIIKQQKSNLSEKEKHRIINLYHGYQYILTNKTIDQEHLKELYSILSDNILNQNDIKNMGKYYRNKEVYILKGNRLNDNPFMGRPANQLDNFMNQFFEFINDNKMEMNQIDIFIKSQIMHFYFVYIHPYFDVNGRTSRTVSIWYLLNHKLYPYVIFNKAIAFAKKEYEANIIKARTNGDVTLFLKYILISVKRELEKEYLIHTIAEKIEEHLSREEYQMLEYFLTMKGNLTAKDLTSIYNHYNPPRKPYLIFEEKILPLLDKNILINKGYTKGFMTKSTPNMNIRLNPDIIDINPSKVKHLSLNKFMYK